MRNLKNAIAILGLSVVLLAACGAPPCQSNADCLNGQACQQGMCVGQGGNMNPPPGPMTGASCTDNSQCLNGQECRGGTCQTAAPMGGGNMTPKPNEGGNGMVVTVIDGDNILEVQSPQRVEVHVGYLKVVNPAGKHDGVACGANSECVSDRCDSGTCRAVGMDNYSGQSVTGHVVKFRKVDICSPGYGFEIWIRVGNTVNASMPAYGCDAGAPSLRDEIRSGRITIKLNGVVINAIGEFVHHPWACGGGGDGNFYMGRLMQLKCP